MEIDIRTAGLSQKITMIRFSSPLDSGDSGCGFSQADCIRLDNHNGNIEVLETNTEDYVRLFCKQDVRNLIQALERALDLLPQMREI